MKLKEIRDYIYSPCVLLFQQTNKEYRIQTHQKTEFDECEVVGIRSREVIIHEKICNSYIEILLK